MRLFKKKSDSIDISDLPSINTTPSMLSNIKKGRSFKGHSQQLTLSYLNNGNPFKIKRVDWYFGNCAVSEYNINKHETEHFVVFTSTNLKWIGKLTNKMFNKDIIGIQYDSEELSVSIDQFHLGIGLKFNISPGCNFLDYYEGIQAIKKYRPMYNSFKKSLKNCDISNFQYLSQKDSCLVLPKDFVEQHFKII